jgi:hypothetical protein
MNPMTDLLFDTLHSRRDLRDRLDRFTRWGYMTRKQSSELDRLIAPGLPCLLTLSCRVKKGDVHVKVGEGESAKEFKLDASACVHRAASVKHCALS